MSRFFLVCIGHLNAHDVTVNSCVLYGFLRVLRLAAASSFEATALNRKDYSPSSLKNCRFNRGKNFSSTKETHGTSVRMRVVKSRPESLNAAQFQHVKIDAGKEYVVLSVPVLRGVQAPAVPRTQEIKRKDLNGKQLKQFKFSRARQYR